ncbi:MAG: hypothetical protein C0615_02715 [Desulfuromonas sp.]|nr:MAG: hypothetical protein C0615_02715 [Desulfuromonas sp.]
MKSIVFLALATLVFSGVAFAADPGDPEAYREVIKRRCTLCHTQERIETAISEGRNMSEIMSKMMKMGATLTDQEQKVLGTFWGSPTKD